MATTRDRSSLGAVGVGVLAVVVLGGIGWGWNDWNAEIDAATVDPDPVVASPSPSPSASSSPSASPTASESSTPSPDAAFAPLAATGGRDAPVVLVVGGGVAAGDGTDDGSEWPSLLAQQTGWEVVVSAAPAVGYRPDPAVGLSRWFRLANPQQTDPDLVVVQGQDLPDVEDGDLRAAVASMSEIVDKALPDTPVVAVTPLPPNQRDAVRERREQIVARGWEDGPAPVLLVRPGPEDWGLTLATDPAEDAAGAEAQATMAEQLLLALEDAGLYAG